VAASLWTGWSDSLDQLVDSTGKGIEGGFSDEIIRRATGHASLEAYRNYVRLEPATLMRLADAPKSEKNPNPDNSGIKAV
jgi:hypothetical protein